MEATFQFRTEPFRHQFAEWERTRDLPYWGLCWEMGVAKTKVLIDTAAWLHLEGKIDGVLVIAPEGVQTQWLRDEVPTHMSDEVHWRGFHWSTARQGGKVYQDQWRDFLGWRGGLAVLAMTYDSLMTQRSPRDPRGLHKGADAAKAFLTSHRCLLILDESTRIKTPGTKVTKRVLAMARYAPYRRIANGTPVSDSPFHAYTQFRFLDPAAWRHLGIQDSDAFRAYFGTFERRFNFKQQRHYDELTGYRNLSDMEAVVSSHSSRLLKRDVFPDLPPKLYSKLYFELSPQQRRHYDALARDFMTELESGEVTAELAIVRQTRLQQVCSGYLPADDAEGNLTPLVPPKDNPRLKLLVDSLAEVPGKVIIWGKYNVDVDLIAGALRTQLGWEVVTWDGRTPEAERLTAKERFINGAARAFISKPSSSAARGLNLQVAETVIYYNNSFVLDDRLQSEDRAHRPGIHHPVKYIDLVSVGTIDEHILNSLRSKRDVSAIVMRDQLAPWI